MTVEISQVVQEIPGVSHWPQGSHQESLGQVSEALAETGKGSSPNLVSI